MASENRNYSGHRIWYLGYFDYFYGHTQICSIEHQTCAYNYRVLNTYTPCYKYKARSVLENYCFRMYYHRLISTDIVALDKTGTKVFLIDVARPGETG